MIKIILGNIGSGKTLTAVMHMMRDSNKTIFTNIKNKLPNTIPLKYSMIIKQVEIGKRRDGSPVYNMEVNWDFWKEAIKKYGTFDIYIDELHNIMMSRRGMSRENICLLKWIAQIRKITGSSEHNHLVVISQELSRVDVGLRDLASVLIYCQKREKDLGCQTRCYQKGKIMTKILPYTYILNYYFTGEDCIERYWRFREHLLKTYNRRTWFLGNEYMQFYDSYQIVDFGEGAYL